MPTLDSLTLDPFSDDSPLSDPQSMHIESTHNSQIPSFSPQILDPKVKGSSWEHGKSLWNRRLFLAWFHGMRCEVRLAGLLYKMKIVIKLMYATTSLSSNFYIKDWTIIVKFSTVFLFCFVEWVRSTVSSFSLKTKLGGFQARNETNFQVWNCVVNYLKRFLYKAFSITNVCQF